jgi:hypothetical protein
VFADLDGAPLDPVFAESIPKPHIISESSPQRWHVYWRVAAGMPLDEFSKLQKGISTRFASDETVHDLPRVLRIPGFIHHKGEPFCSRLQDVEPGLEPYDWAALAAIFPAPKDAPRAPQPARDDDYGSWRHLNDAALDRLDDWVTRLFPDAKRSRNKSLRVSSASLGRNLEEDISFHPTKGIKDFGVHDQGDSRGGRRTPIDIVVEHLPTNERSAVRWLCNALGLDVGRFLPSEQPKREATNGTAETNVHDKQNDQEQPKPRVRWTLPLMTWRDPATIPRRQFLYAHYYARGVLSATVADGGMGKSVLKIAEMLAMITGRNLLGIAPRERVRCLYWNGDDPYVEIERRIYAVAQHHGIDLKALLDDGWLTLGTSDTHPLCLASINRGALVVNTGAIEDICTLIQERGIGLVCFDPFKSLHRVPENDNTSMDAVADALKLIAVHTDAAVAVDHHIRKPAFGQGEATTADARGAIALINKARLSRVCNVMTPEQAVAAHIKEDDRANYFRVDLGKANIAPPGKATWFKRVPILCANGEHTPVVLPWKFPGPFDTVTPDHMHRVREMARTGAYRRDPQAGDWIGLAVAEVLDLDADDEADRKQIAAILKTWFGNGVLATEPRKDEHRKMRPFVVPGNWSDDEADAGAPP